MLVYCERLNRHVEPDVAGVIQATAHAERFERWAAERGLTVATLSRHGETARDLIAAGF